MSEQQVQQTQQPVEQSADKPVEQPVVNQTVAETATPQPTSWVDNLPEDIKHAKSLQSFKSVEDLAKSYIHLNSLRGKKLNEMTPAEVNEFYAKLGRPNKPEEYKLPTDQIGDEAVKEMAQWSFDLGLSQDKANTLVNKFIEMTKRELGKLEKKQSEEITKHESVLKEKLGPAYEQRLNLARDTITKIGGTELLNTLKNAGLVTIDSNNNIRGDSNLLLAMAKLGKEMTEDVIVKTEQDKVFGTTPEEARNELNKKLLDPEFRNAFYSLSHPAHKAAVEEFQRLISIKR